MPVCDVCRGAHVEGVAKLGHARFCNLCGGARFGSRAKPSLDIPVCDYCACGAFLGSRARPRLDMRVCGFCCGALGRGRSRAWTCQFVTFVVVLTSRVWRSLDMQGFVTCVVVLVLGRGRSRAWTYQFVTFVLVVLSLGQGRGQCCTCEFVTLAVLLTLGRGRRQVWTCQLVTFVVMLIFGRARLSLVLS